MSRLSAALADRYAISREIGAGGMATVYLADDLKHRRKVAVKVLRPELAATLGAERFLREIEVAAGLTHPHILPVHDSGEAGGFLFYVMPYIEGESLGEKLKREGELPVDEAVRIVRQIVDALSHAHGRGVVHRDIKPDNVMISGRHAMVMDFGVAKAVSEAAGGARLTTAGIALGTPMYMSPEQASADPNIDHRADIYAVGAMAYELLAGRPPFTGATSHQVLAGHLTETPAPVSKHRPAVPAMLNNVVMKCLEKNAADRWQTAEELLPHLDAFATPTGGITPTTMQPVAASKAAGRKPLAIGGAVALAAAIGVLVFVIPGGSDLVENRVLVAVFDNATGDQTLDQVGKIAADLLARGLQEIRLVEVVDPRAALTFTSDAVGTAARTLAEQVGAAIFVSGEYYRLRDSLTFQVQITETASGRLIQSLDPIAAAASDPMDGMQQVNQRVMAAVASQFSPDLADLADAIRLPASYDSYREFITGTELFSQGNLAEAARHFYRATAIDPEYVGAAVYLAIVYADAGQPAAADSITTALNASRERLTETERLTVDWIRAELRGDQAAAYRAILQVRDLLPTLPEPGWAAGQAATALNRPREGLEYLTVLPPERGVYSGQPMLWADMTEAYHMLGEHEAELEAAQRGREQFPNDLNALGYELRVLAALGRIDAVNKGLDEALTLRVESGTPAGVMRNAALELMAHGHEEAAAQVLDRAIDWYNARPGDWDPYLALTLFVAGRWDEARQAYRRLALESPNDLEYQLQLELLALYAGDRDEESVLDSLLAAAQRNLPYQLGRPTRARAMLAAALGDRERAVNLLRDAFSEGVPYGIWLHQEPAFDSLRGYPPFQELLRPKG
ncbi:MAG: serine/threonine-protein kinase [Gemmatimonadetes bacterium]|nr:serine/threonine-protein kinase [Gemmatimonadota bacterium]